MFLLDNVAFNAGGGIVLLSFSSVSIDSVELISNKALSGGCLFISDRYNSSITNVIFDNCVSETTGGGIAISGYASPVITNSIISNCIADSVGSGVIALAFADSFFDNVTIM